MGQHNSVHTQPIPDVGDNARVMPEVAVKDEFAHLGTVSVKLSWLTANVRYTPEQQNDITVTGKGAIFHGPNTASPEVMRGLMFWHYFTCLILF